VCLEMRRPLHFGWERMVQQTMTKRQKLEGVGQVGHLLDSCTVSDGLVTPSGSVRHDHKNKQGG
jgi:hypothetical protein